MLRYSRRQQHWRQSQPSNAAMPEFGMLEHVSHQDHEKPLGVTSRGEQFHSDATDKTCSHSQRHGHATKNIHSVVPL